ncbi:MAG: hypothetical protein ACTSWR_11970 [Candidatus Helarchaeota archaeon]
MSYIEKSLSWIINRMILSGIKTLSKGINLFFTSIVLVMIVSSSLAGSLIPIIGIIPFQYIMAIQFSVMIGFLISSVIFLKIKSSILRILISLGLISIISVYIIMNNSFLALCYDLTGFIILISLILIVLNIVIFIKNTQNSWYLQLLMLGKSPRHFFFEKVFKFLTIASFFLFIYPIYEYLISWNPYHIILAIFGITAGILSSISIFKTLKFEFNDIYKSIISILYLISFIFLYFYYENTFLIITIDLLIFSMTFLSMVQHVKYWKTEGGISSVKIDAPRNIEDKSRNRTEEEVIFDESDDSVIIIDNISDKQIDNEVEIPITEEKPGVTDKLSYYLIIMVLILGIQLLFLRYFSLFFGMNLFSLILFQDFSLTNYILTLGIYISIIIIFVLYFMSDRFRNYFTFPPGIRKSFLEFLSLMDRKERTKLLRAISRTVQQIIVEGLIELIESEKGNIIDTISEGIKRGAKFFRSIFGDRED